MAKLMAHHQTTQLEQLLRSAVQTSATLLAALQQEFTTLGMTDHPETFIAALQDKQDALDKLGKIDAALLRMETQGFHPGTDSRRFFISRYGDTCGERIEQIWREFLNLLEQCQQQNSVNGCMLKRQQAATQQALAILRGQDGDPAANYGPTGFSTTRATAAIPLAKA